MVIHKDQSSIIKEHSYAFASQVIALVLVYVTVVVAIWRPDNSFYFMLLGQTLWIVLIAYACSFLGALQVPVFLASLTYALAGVIYDLRERRCSEKILGDIATATTDDDKSAAAVASAASASSAGLVDKMISLLDVPSFYKTGDLTTPAASPVLTRPPTILSGATSVGGGSTSLATVSEAIGSGDGDTPASRGGDRPRMRLNVTSEQQEAVAASSTGEAASSTSAQSHHSQSGFYFRALFLACLATVFYNHCWLLIVAAVPIGVHLASEATVAFAVRDVLSATLAPLAEQLHGWVIVRHSAVLPVCLPGVLRLNRKVHRLVRRALRDSIDTASSILMIVLLLVTVIFAGVFCAVEIYSEAITVVQLGNDVVNWTLCHRPELMNMFPEGVTNSMDDVIENAYQYGRTGIGTYVDELLKDADGEQRQHLREQLLSVWDRLVQYWLDRKKEMGNGGGGGGPGGTFNGPQVPASAISDQLGEIVNNEGSCIV